MVVLSHGQYNVLSQLDNVRQQPRAGALPLTFGLDTEAKKVQERAVVTDDGVGVYGVTEHEHPSGLRFTLEERGAHGIVREE